MAVSTSTNAAEKGRPQAPMSFPGLCLRNLTGRPLRSSLTALGIGVAIGSFIALTGTSRGFNRAWTRSLTERGVHIVAVRKRAIQLMAATIDETAVEAMRRVEGVEAVAGELIDFVTLDGDRSALVRGWRAGGFLWSTLDLREGTVPGPDQLDGAVLGADLADELRVGVGGTVDVYDEALSVTGIARSESVMNRRMIVVQLPSLQDLMERPGKVTLVDIRVRNPGHTASLAQTKGRLTERFPTLRFDVAEDVARHDRLMQLLRAFNWSLSLIALCMGILVTLNTFLMAVMERTYDIGVLSSLGWPRRRIVAMIVTEGMLLSLVGGGVGVLLGMGALEALSHVELMRGMIEPVVTPANVVRVIVATLLIGLAGSAFPAWRAGRLRPVEALRHP